MAKHSITHLIANSSYIGQQCPISHRQLRVGDKVIICEQSRTVFDFNAWQEILPHWSYTCQFCRTTVKNLAEYVPPPTPIPKKPNTKLPTYEPTRRSGLRTLSQWAGIAVFVVFVAIVAFNLGQINFQTPTGSSDDFAEQTPISLTVEPMVPTLTELPTIIQLHSATSTPQLAPTHTPSPATIRPITPLFTPTHTPDITIDQLQRIVINKARSSTVYTAYSQQVDNFIAALLHHLPEFQLPKLGITEPVMREVLKRPDVGDRVNGLVQEVWDEWNSVVRSKNLNAMNADPSNQGLSPLRQLVIRMIQGRQGQLVDSQQHALHNILTRSEEPSIWSRDMDSVIGAVNRESCIWP